MKAENPSIVLAHRARTACRRTLINLTLLIGIAAALPCGAAAPLPADGRTTQTQSVMRKILNAFSFKRRATPPPVDRPVPLAGLRGAALEARLGADLRALAEARAGLLGLLDHLRKHPEEYRAQPAAGAPDAAPLAAARAAWCALCDRCLGLEALARYYDDFQSLRGQPRADAFLARRAAFLAACRAALEFGAAMNDAALEAALNEPLPGLGLPAGFYTRFKDRFTNGAERELAALEAIDRDGGGNRYPAIHSAAAEDARAIAALGRGPRQSLTPEAALDLLLRGRGANSFNLEPAVADVEGGASERTARTSVAKKRTDRLLGQLDPGDILLLRRDGRLAALGQPGYWTHAALYTGTAAERIGYFNESEVKAWAIGQGQDDFEGLLRAAGPDGYTSATAPRGDGLPARVIEVLAPGASFTTLERSAGATAVAVLRPRVSKLAKAQALLRAFACNGRPGDPFEDFGSDAELSDTELIRIAYAPGPGGEGLSLPLLRGPGRAILPPNELARLFDAGFETAQQPFDFVCFIDGPSSVASLADFRQSWRRPKWRIHIEETLPPPVPLPPARNRLAWETFGPTR